MSHLNQAGFSGRFVRPAGGPMIPGARRARGGSMLPTAGIGKDIPGLPEMDLDHQLQLALVESFEKAKQVLVPAEIGKL